MTGEKVGLAKHDGTMEQFFPCVKRKRVFESGSVPRTWAKSMDESPSSPSSPAPIPEEDFHDQPEGEEEEEEEFDLLFIDFLEDAPKGQPSEWARLLITWSDKSHTTCAVGDLLESTDVRTARMLSR